MGFLMEYKWAIKSPRGTLPSLDNDGLLVFLLLSQIALMYLLDALWRNTPSDKAQKLVFLRWQLSKIFFKHESVSRGTQQSNVL